MKVEVMIDERGNVSYGSDLRAYQMRERLKKYAGDIADLEIETKDSWKERKYWEGGWIPYLCSIIPGYDPKNISSRSKMRETAKQEAYGEIVPDFQGNPTKIADTSKGKVQDLINYFIGWCMENGYAVPNPKLYKTWRDKFFCDYGDYWIWLEKNNLNVDGTKKNLDNPTQ